MRIVVCIKQVFDPATVRVSSRGDLATQDGVRIINPADLCALEEALLLKDAQGAQIIVLSLGGPESEDALREALALGADRAVLLSDAAFAGGDAHTASYILARAVETIGHVDMALAGARALDDGAGQVGPEMAEILGWPQITNACQLRLGGGRAAAIQSFEDGHRRVSVALPCVITVAELTNTPRLATVASIMNAYGHPAFDRWAAADIGADPAHLGAEGSRTMVRRSFPPEPLPKGDFLSGGPADVAAALAARLRKRGFI
jgi:electron transfer flavoprotein beta subunit